MEKKVENLMRKFLSLNRTSTRSITCERLKAVEIEGICLEELDAGATDGRGELLGDGVHGVPEACHPQAVVRVHPSGRPVVLIAEHTQIQSPNHTKSDASLCPRGGRCVPCNRSDLPTC